MSETVENPLTDDAASENAAADAESQEAQQATEIPEGAETPEGEAAAEPKPGRKVQAGDRRFAHLTARAASLAEDLAETKRRAEAAEELLRATKSGEAIAPKQSDETPHQIARRIVAEERFVEKRTAVALAGNNQFGAEEWGAKTDVLHGLGALNNTDFMETLVDLPNAADVVAALSEDTDSLIDMLGKSPRQMAAALGRMSAKLETPAVTQTPKPISKAPRPPAPVTATNVAREKSVYDKGATSDMAAYKAQLAKEFPSLFGGRRAS
jgi:hypothetical protein